MKTQAIISSPIAKTLVYANVFIAFCAAAQVLITYKLFSVPLTYANATFILFVFLATYLQYNVQRGYFIANINLNTESGQWLGRYKRTMFVSLFLSLAVLLFLCNNLSYTSVGIMVGAELVSTFYYLPPFNLRKCGYIKPLIISLIWVISCTVVPLIENHMLNWNSAWFIFSQFCFISVLCILFDIKDMTDDYLNGIDTYANRFGVMGTKWICVVFSIAMGVSFYVFRQSQDLVPELIITALTIFTVFITSEKKHRFYYYLWVDGLLLLQAILFLIF